MIIREINCYVSVRNCAKFERGFVYIVSIHAVFFAFAAPRGDGMNCLPIDPFYSQAHDPI